MNNALANLGGKLLNFGKEKAPILLLGAAGTGVILTALSAIRDTRKSDEPTITDYIPTMCCAVGTIVLMGLCYRAQGAETTAVAAAGGLVAKEAYEYRNVAGEIFGPEADAKINEVLKLDRAGKGEVGEDLMYEEITGTYFWSTKDRVGLAYANVYQSMTKRKPYAKVQDLCAYLNIDEPIITDLVGWHKTDGIVSPVFTKGETFDGHLFWRVSPSIAPRADYRKKDSLPWEPDCWDQAFND